jgi:hypothetical protein
MNVAGGIPLCEAAPTKQDNVQQNLVYHDDDDKASEDHKCAPCFVLLLPLKNLMDGIGEYCRYIEECWEKEQQEIKRQHAIADRAKKRSNDELSLCSPIKGTRACFEELKRQIEGCRESNRRGVAQLKQSQIRNRQKCPKMDEQAATQLNAQRRKIRRDSSTDNTIFPYQRAPVCFLLA